MNKLPDHPADLIELAIDDLEKAEQIPRYVISMSCWHSVRNDGSCHVCHVCLAGAVIAGTLHAHCDENSNPSRFDIDTGQKLNSLDCFRTGDIADAFALLNLDLPADLPRYVWVEQYADDADQFKSDMINMAQMIREAMDREATIRRVLHCGEIALEEASAECVMYKNAPASEAEPILV